MQPTADPNVFIEARGEDWVRYFRTTDNRRWEVHGRCDRRGDCLIGAVIENEHGEPEMIRDHAHIRELKKRLGRERIDSEMDVPVTPEFDTCCGDPQTGTFTYVGLDYRH